MDVESIPNDFDFIIEYSFWERYFSPISLGVVCLGVVGVLCVALPDIQFPVFGKISLTVVVSVVIGLLFWNALRNGRFVLAANRSGIYYRSAKFGERLVGLSWSGICGIDMVDDGSLELEVRTLYGDVTEVPTPLNGTRYMRNQKVELTFFPGVSQSSDHIINTLRAFQHQSSGV